MLLKVQKWNFDFFIPGGKRQTRKGRETWRPPRQRSSQMAQFVCCSNPKMTLHINCDNRVWTIHFQDAQLDKVHCIFSHQPHTYWHPLCSQTTLGDPCSEQRLAGYRPALLPPSAWDCIPRHHRYKQQLLIFIQSKQRINRNHVCITRGLSHTCFSHRQAKMTVKPLVFSRICKQ